MRPRCVCSVFRVRTGPPLLRQRAGQEHSSRQTWRERAVNAPPGDPGSGSKGRTGQKSRGKERTRAREKGLGAARCRNASCTKPSDLALRQAARKEKEQKKRQRNDRRKQFRRQERESEDPQARGKTGKAGDVRYVARRRHEVKLARLQRLEKSESKKPRAQLQHEKERKKGP